MQKHDNTYAATEYVQTRWSSGQAVVDPSCADSSDNGINVDILLLIDTGIDSSRPVH
jgi:hypothetical protein